MYMAHYPLWLPPLLLRVLSVVKRMCSKYVVHGTCFTAAVSGTCCAALRCYTAYTVLCSFLLHCCGTMCYALCYADDLYSALVRCGVKGLCYAACAVLCCTVLCFRCAVV